jgi:Cd2+/Zn2+-exporting ATPase
MPEDKLRILEQLMTRDAKGGKLAFVGDGINDAPVIARADVGVAMGALGSDAAIETADVVLMTDSPLKMVEAVHIARQTRAIVWQNIVMALAIKVLFVVLGAMGVASMWEAVFADMGVALAAVVNATRALKFPGP